MPRIARIALAWIVLAVIGTAPAANDVPPASTPASPAGDDPAAQATEAARL